MLDERLVLQVASPDTVQIFTGSGSSLGGVWTNTLKTPFVLETVDIAALSSSANNSGFLEAQPAAAPFFFFNGDSTPAGGLWRQWNGRLVVYNGQEVSWTLLSGDSSATWGLTLSGHWELGWRPSF